MNGKEKFYAGLLERKSLIKKAVKKAGVKPTDADLQYLADETKTNVDFVKATLEAEGLL